MMLAPLPVSARMPRLCNPHRSTNTGITRFSRVKCSEEAKAPESSSGKQQPGVPAVERDDTELEVEAPRRQGKRARKADSTDAIATFLTRRFGLAGGLAWLGVLTFGVVSEHLKTRGEVARESVAVDVVDATEVTTASGLRYTDIRRGGGETAPQRGYLLAIDLRIEDGSTLLFDSGNRQLAFFFKARPLKPPMCLGIEEGIAGMHVGSVRRMTIPAALGVPPGTQLPGGAVAPDGHALTYTVKLTRVSVPPS